MSVAVVTAVFGNYDSLKEPVPQSVPADWICITDDGSLSSDIWKMEVHSHGTTHPRSRAKIPKFMPWLYTNADTTIWVDASAQVVSPTFVEEALAALGDASMAQFRHPWRDCIYEEAQASLPLAKYEGLPILAQVESYRSKGHPEHWGLWATGVIARHHDETQKELGRRWAHHCYAWTYQDQLSEPFLLRELDVNIADLPHDLVANPWLRWHEHASVL